MALKIRSTVSERPNSVPYSSNFDNIQRNYGFTDLRGRPDLVDGVVEGAASAALRALLMRNASTDAPFMTLGCDLGGAQYRSTQINQRWLRGGYVQLALLPLGRAERQILGRLATACADFLKSVVGGDRWEVDFSLCLTWISLPDRIETETLWVWFNAWSSTEEKATLSRERLIEAIGQGFERAAAEGLAER